jgi:NAD(P)-dependent dehydrogenase (short-subunit alcohol dehydrogenase family)
LGDGPTDAFSTGAPRTAVVTGASAGIGRAIAIALGALGWSVAVGARRVAALEETAALVGEAGGKTVARELDVTDAGSVDAFFDAVRAVCGPVDVLVNNAGIALPGAVDDMADDDHARIVATNLLGPILMTKRVVAELRATERPGDVVFVSSDTTVHPRPRLTTYLASKAGLEAFAAALALECEGSGIRSSVVRVGPTTSGFADEWDPEKAAALIPYWEPFGVQRHWNMLAPEDVARAVVAVVTAPMPTWLPLVEVQPRPPVA